MRKTNNLKLNLPDGTDPIDITVLNENFSKLDEQLAPVMVSDLLEVTYARGRYYFYHGTLMSFEKLLEEVDTTWGKAVFREKYGEFTPTEGESVDLNIVVEVLNGTIYWDEYYNRSDVGVHIGRATFTRTSTGDTMCEFEYFNDDAGESKELSLREAVIELLSRITVRGS